MPQLPGKDSEGEHILDNMKHSISKSLLRFESLLIVVLVIEWFVFARTGTNFATQGNTFEIVKFSVEIGLLALVMTPVIITGGIDLSVGSLLGLCAVCFGKLWRDGGLDWPVAAVATLGIGALAGGLNALLITRLRLPPLIVTLGSFSLFRGLAEALTRGVDNFTGFPQDFLAYGQGYYGVIPAQVPVFALAAVLVWLLVHRTTFGRSFRAIGFAPEGARYAGLPVQKRLALAYVLSGLFAAIAALIYVARVGQAKADAGSGYELARHHGRRARRHQHFRRRRFGAWNIARRRNARGVEEWPAAFGSTQ